MAGPRKPAPVKTSELWKDYPRLVRECAEGVFEELAKKTKCNKAERKEGVCDGVVAVLIEGADVNEIKKKLAAFKVATLFVDAVRAAKGRLTRVLGMKELNVRTQGRLKEDESISFEKLYKLQLHSQRTARSVKRSLADASVDNAPPAKNVRFAPDASHESAPSSIEQPTKTEPPAVLPADSEELRKLRAENEALRAKIENLKVTISTLTDLMGNRDLTGSVRREPQGTKHSAASDEAESNVGNGQKSTALLMKKNDDLFGLGPPACKSQAQQLPKALEQIITEEQRARLEKWNTGSPSGLVHSKRAKTVKGGQGDIEFCAVDVVKKTIGIKRNIETAKDLEQFLDEADLMYTSAHPNLMPILARSFDQDNLYYIMSRMRPGALDEVVGQKAISLEAAAHVTHEVLVFVDSLHRNSGKVHRDLKPANILDNKEAAVLVTDFGFCSSAVRTMATQCGTPGFMEPEIDGGAYDNKVPTTGFHSAILQLDLSRCASLHVR